MMNQTLNTIPDQSLKEALSVKEEALRKAEEDLSSREAGIREAALKEEHTLSHLLLLLHYS